MNFYDLPDHWDHWSDGDGGYDMGRIPDQVIMGLVDGYDDRHVDAVVFALLRLRRLERERTGAPEPPACEECDHPGCMHMRTERPQ